MRRVNTALSVILVLLYCSYIISIYVDSHPWVAARIEAKARYTYGRIRYRMRVPPWKREALQVRGIGYDETE